MAKLLLTSSPFPCLEDAFTILDDRPNFKDEHIAIGAAPFFTHNIKADSAAFIYKCSINFGHIATKPIIFSHYNLTITKDHTNSVVIRRDIFEVIQDILHPASKNA
jgi:hypothetical protein